MPSSIAKEITAPRRRPSRPRRPGRPAGADGEATRRALLDGALHAFAEHGYEAMSVRDLARRVGVSHNLVHHYYGSKWALWQAALEHGFAPSGRELFALIEANRRAHDWEVANRAGITGAMQLFARYPAVARIMADESARGGKRLDFLFERYVKPFVGLLGGLLDGARREGERGIDPRAAVLFLFAGMTAPFALGGLAAKLGASTPPSERELRRFAGTVSELIAHGLGRAGAARRSGSRGKGERCPT